MTLYAAPICLGCLHYHRAGIVTRDTLAGKAPPPTGYCDAFPIDAGIPLLIWHGAVDHRQPVDGDRGVQYQPKTADAARYAAVLFRDANDAKAKKGAP